MMNIEEYRNYCLSFKGTDESFPFDDRTLVFKVAGKMFSATDVEDFEMINVKCDPVKALELREEYDAVIPAYYMNKKHWNSIRTDGNIPDNLIRQWIRDSYDLVVAKLPKKVRETLR